jgi:hypothetical protein
VARLAQKVAKTDTAENATAPVTVAYFESFRVSENGFLNVLGRDGKDRFIDITVHPKRSKIQRAFVAMLDAIDKSGVKLVPDGTLKDTALRMKINGMQEISRNKIKIWLNRSLDLEVKTPKGKLFKLADYMPTEQPRQLEQEEAIPF